MRAALWTKIERCVGVTLIVAFVISITALILAMMLRALDVAEPIPSLVGTIGIVAMIVTLVSVLAWRIVCAISWVRWFARKRTKRG